MRKTDVRTEADINQYLTGARKIKFLSDRVVSEQPTLREIFTALITNEPATCYMRGGEHCPQGRYRSLYDFTLLAKKYVPEATLKDVLFLLFDYYSTPNGRNVRRLLYCPTVRRYNFRGSWPSGGTGGAVSLQILRDITSAISMDYSNFRYGDVSDMVNTCYAEFLLTRV